MRYIRTSARPRRLAALGRSMHPAATPIVRFLRRLRWRSLGLSVVELAAVAGIVGIGAAWVAAVLGRRGENAPWLQSLVVGAMFLGPLVWWLRVQLPRHLPVRSLPAAADAVDARRAVPGPTLRSALELSGRADGASAVLVDAAILGAVEGLGGLSPGQLVSSRPARRATLALTTALLATSVFRVAAPSWMEEGWRTFFTRPAGVVAAALARPEDEGLALGDIKLTLSYPAYLRREAEVIENSTGKVRAPAGTVVEIAARIEGGAERAQLAVGEDVPVEATLTGNRIGGSFTVSQPGSYRFLLHRGGSMEPSRAYTVEVEVDELPTVDLEGVSDAQELPASGSLPFSVRARDDHGLTDLTFVVSEGGKETRKQVSTFEDQPDAWSGDGVWYPTEWGVTPGATVEVWVEVRDNDTVNGPKVGSSRRFPVHIASDEQRHEQTLALKEKLKEHLLAALGENLVWGSIQTRVKGADVIASEHKLGLQVMEPVLSGFRELREAASGDTMEEVAVLTSLLATEQEITRSWDELEGTSALLVGELSRSVSLFRRSVSERGSLLDEQRQRVVAGLERAVLSMESFANLQRLEDILTKGDRLRDTADNLRQLLSDKDADLAKLLTEIDKMEAELGQMAQRMQDLDQESADWFQNPSGDVKDMKSALDEIRELLAQGKREEAKAKMEEYAQHLEEMMAGLEDMQKEQFDGVREQASRDVGQVIDSVKQLEREQARLTQDTEAVAKMAEQAAGAGEEELKKAFEQALRRAEKIQKDLDAARTASEGSPANPSADNQLQQAVEEGRLLESALQAQDLWRAIQHAEGVMNQAQWLQAQARTRQFQSGASREEFRSSAASAGAEAQRLREDLDELAEKMRQARAQGSAQSQSASARQGELRQQSEGVSRTLGEYAQESAFVPGEWSEQLQQASKSMESARQKMAEGDLRSAGADQRAAGESLRSLREQMESAQQALEQQQRNMAQGVGQGQPGQPGESGQGQQPGQPAGQGGRETESWGGRQNNRGSVEILRAEQGGEEYRKELMEGMKGETPERYQRQNRAYYERLVR